MLGKLFQPQVPYRVDKFPFFYGYIIIIGSIICACITAPGQTMGVAAFTDYFIRDFHLTRVQLSTTYMLGTLMSSLVIMRVGGLIDRYGSRIVAVMATILLGIALSCLSQIDNITQALRFLPVNIMLLQMALLAVGFFLLRFSAQGVLTLVSRTITLKWFESMRGRMSSIVGIFLTVAMSAAPVMFNSSIHSIGWRETYLVTGLIIGGVCSVVLWFILRDLPEQFGLLPDGRKINPHQALNSNSVPRKEWEAKEAHRTFIFWIFNLSFALYAFLSTAVSFHLTSIFDLAGLSRTQAIDIFFPAATISIAVKIISGWVCDIPHWQNNLKYQLFIFLIALITLCISLLFLQDHWVYYVIIVSYGVATGLFVTVSSVCWAQFFGRKHVGAISSLNSASLIFASAIAPLFFAEIFKHTASYNSALISCLILASGLFMLALKLKQQR